MSRLVNYATGNDKTSARTGNQQSGVRMCGGNHTLKANPAKCVRTQMLVYELMTKQWSCKISDEVHKSTDPH